MGVRLVINGKSQNEGGGGTYNHYDLRYREAPDQHPIEAITGLEEALLNLVREDEHLEQEVLLLQNEYNSLPHIYKNTKTITFTRNLITKDIQADVRIVNSKENAIEIRNGGLFVDRYFDLEIENTPTVHLYFEGKGDTLKEMYESGNVFSHCRTSWNNIYSATEADAWYFNDTLQSFVQPLNTEYLTGFISNVMYRTYTHKAVLRSSDADDDVNGLIIAYTLDNEGKPHTLSCVVERGPDFTWHYALIYDFGLPDETVLFTAGNTSLGSGTLANTSGWSNSYITMEVEKQGTIVTCAVSQWNSDTINPATTITIDLNDYEWGQLFAEHVRYGYCNWSQANSYFTDIVFQGKGPLQASVILSRDTDNNIEIRQDGLWCKGGSDVSAASSILEVQQEAHGLIVGDLVYCDSDGIYRKSIAEDSVKIETIGIVTEVIDEDNFIITISGQFETDLFDAYTDGTVLYLSETTAGTFTDDPSRIFKPIAIKIDGSIIINIQRANHYKDISEGASSGSQQDSEVEYYTYEEMWQIIDEIWQEEDMESAQNYNMLDYATAPVGTVISVMSNSAPTGYLICDGTEYNIVDYPILAAHFEAEFGLKNKFGGDGVITFAVPDARERYFKGSDTSGTYTEAGLPNITGNIGSINAGQNWNEWVSRNTNGAFSPISVRNIVGIAGGSTDNIYRATFNASRSSAIYGRSNTVTPKNISVLYCIKY